MENTSFSMKEEGFLLERGRRRTWQYKSQKCLALFEMSESFLCVFYHSQNDICRVSPSHCSQWESNKPIVFNGKSTNSESHTELIRRETPNKTNLQSMFFISLLVSNFTTPLYYCLLTDWLHFTIPFYGESFLYISMCGVCVCVCVQKANNITHS